MNILAMYLYRKNGKHIGVVGTTGAGKTQILFEIVSGLITFHKKEIIVWFDTGKSSDALVLATMGPVIFHHEIGTKIVIEYNSNPKVKLYPVEFKTYTTMKTLIKNFERGKINVVSIRPFVRKADEYVKRLSEFFQELYDFAYDYDLKKLGLLPIAFVFDELQMICPSERHALNAAHSQAATEFEYNVEQMRSFAVRIVGATQQYNRIKTGVRNAIKWWFVKRGAIFRGNKKMERIQYTTDSLSDDQTLLYTEEKGYYSDEKLVFKFYGDGEDYGFIYYMNDPVPVVSSCEGADQQAGSPCE